MSWWFDENLCRKSSVWSSGPTTFYKLIVVLWGVRSMQCVPNTYLSLSFSESCRSWLPHPKGVAWQLPRLFTLLALRSSTPKVRDSVVPAGCSALICKAAVAVECWFIAGAHSPIWGCPCSPHSALPEKGVRWMGRHQWSTGTKKNWNHHCAQRSYRSDIYSPQVVLGKFIMDCNCQCTQNDYRTELYYFRIIFGNSCSVTIEPICSWN